MNHHSDHAECDLIFSILGLQMLFSLTQTSRDCWSTCESLIEYCIQFDSVLELHMLRYSSIVAVQYQTVDYSHRKVSYVLLRSQRVKYFFPPLTHGPSFEISGVISLIYKMGVIGVFVSFRFECECDYDYEI